MWMLPGIFAICLSSYFCDISHSVPHCSISAALMMNKSQWKSAHGDLETLTKIKWAIKIRKLSFLVLYSSILITDVRDKPTGSWTIASLLPTICMWENTLFWYLSIMLTHSTHAFFLIQKECFSHFFKMNIYMTASCLYLLLKTR